MSVIEKVKVPSQEKEYRKGYRAKNREHIRQREKEYYHTHKELRRQQFKNFYDVHSEERRAKTREWTQKNKERNRIVREKLRMKVLEKLGKKCNNPNCPIPSERMDLRALQIDHINGNGHEDRKHHNPVQYLNKVLKDTNENYQLLCAYCNWIKKYDKKEFSTAKWEKTMIDKNSDLLELCECVIDEKSKI